MGPLIRGPRAGPSGGTSQWWGQDWRNCCQDWTVEVDRGSHSLRGHPSRVPGLGPVALEFEELEMEELNLGELNLGESELDSEEFDLEELNFGTLSLGELELEFEELELE